MSAEDFDTLFGDKKKKKPTDIKGKEIKVIEAPIPTATTPPMPTRKIRPSKTTTPRAPKQATLDTQKLTKDIITGISKNLSELVKKEIKDNIKVIPEPISTVNQKDDILKPDVIRNLTTLIEKQQEKIQELEPASIHVFTERNALIFAMFNIRTGYKPKGMWTFFMTTNGQVTLEDIQKMDKYFQENEYVKPDKNGWRKLTEKGRKRIEELKEGN